MSSSESEDENLKKFAASLDTTVFSNNLYNGNAEKVNEKPKIELKSQRVLDDEENIMQSEINVSSTMQQFIGKKLSKLIDEQVEFVEVQSVDSDDQVIDNVRLLSGTKKVVKYIDEPTYVENREKVPIKRRKVDSNESEIKDSAKIEQAAIEPEAIQEEVKLWNKKPKHQPIEYKNLKGIGYIREPQNEFTKARNKNNWTESKIKTAKFHNPPICDLIKR